MSEVSHVENSSIKMLLPEGVTSSDHVEILPVKSSALFNAFKPPMSYGD